jgi:uncharacterized protein (DUF1810 family)
MAAKNRTAGDIFGSLDAKKFRSSMTLFAKAAPEHEIFINAIEKYFAGEFDPLTAARLQQPRP